MTLVNAAILFLTVAIDASLFARVGPIGLTPHLSTIFLLYLGFRRPFTQVFAAVAVFVVLAHPFTGLNPAGVALSHWGVLYAVCRLRRKMFAESYVTNAAWAALFSWVLQWLADFELKGLDFFRVAAWRAVEFTANSALIGLLTVPLFIFWDASFEAAGKRGRGTA